MNEAEYFKTYCSEVQKSCCFHGKKAFHCYEGHWDNGNLVQGDLLSFTFISAYKQVLGRPNSNSLTPLTDWHLDLNEDVVESVCNHKHETKLLLQEQQPMALEWLTFSWPCCCSFKGKEPDVQWRTKSKARLGSYASSSWQEDGTATHYGPNICRERRHVQSVLTVELPPMGIKSI